MMTVPGGASWAPTTPKDMKTYLNGNVGKTSGEGQASSGRSSGSGLGKKSSFFGINIDQKTPRIILLLDTSDTMFKRKRGADTYTYDYGVIKKEACDLIKNLEETAQFNVVLYEGGAVAFQKNMVVLSDSLKSEVIQWISDIDENPGKSIKERQNNDSLFEGGGTRLDTGLSLAFRYDPTTIFLLTDGDANIRNGKESKKLKEEDIIPLIKQLQSKQKKSATIHVIYYQTKEAKESETELVKAIAAQGRGTFKVVKAQMVGTDKVKKDVEEKKK
jgi:sulfur relay (sulfurtransferase) DsrF/TusC family protein